MKAWEPLADQMTLLVLNTDDEEGLPKTGKFCEKHSITARPEPTYIHGAFIDEEPEGFDQFKMQYIPHISVLSADGMLLANREQVPNAIAIAQRSLDA